MVRRSRLSVKSSTLVLFDLDGIVIKEDIRPLFGRLAYALSKTFGAGKLPKRTICGATDTFVIQKLAAYNSIKKRQVKRHRRELHSYASEFVKLHINEANPSARSDFKILFSSILKEKYHVGLVTGNLSQIAEIKLKQVGLQKAFEFYRFDDGSGAKDGMLRSVVKEFKSRSTERQKVHNVIYVGDSTSDVIAAKHVRIKSVAVANGVASHSKLRAVHPDLLVKSLSERSKIMKFIKRGVSS